MATIPAKLRSARMVVGGGGGESVTSTCIGRIGYDVGDGDARFDMAVDPDPSCTSGGTPLIFGWPGGPGTSFATIQVDGQNFIYGSSGTASVPPGKLSDGRSYSEWFVGANGKVAASQFLDVVPGSSGTPDTLQIQYQLYNADSVDHLVGVRVMVDLASGVNDAPVIIPSGAPALTTETEFGLDFMPGLYFVMPGQAGAPLAIGDLGTREASVPDRLVFGSWPRLAGTVFDFQPDPTVSLANDVAAAYYWYPTRMAPSTFVTWTTRIGLPAPGTPVPTGPQLTASLSFSPNPPAVDSERAIALTYQPVTMTAVVRNTGDAPATGIVCTPTWPDDFNSTNANGEPDSVPDTGNPSSFDLAPGEERSVSYTLTTAAQYGQNAHDEQFTVGCAAREDASATAFGTLTLPAMGFLPSEAGWGFSNSFFGKPEDVPPYEKMADYYPDSAWEMTWPVVGGHTFLGDAFYNYLFSPNYIGGWCFGMATSTALLYNQQHALLHDYGSDRSLPGDPLAPVPPTLSPGDKVARDVAWRSHSRQLGAYTVRAMAEQFGPDSTLGNHAMFQQLKAAVRSGPVMVALTPRAQDFVTHISEWNHHAHEVVAYSTRDNPPMVRVYDPNLPLDNTSRIELVGADGMQLVGRDELGNVVKAFSANDPSVWLMMPMDLSLAETDQNSLLGTNRKWAADYAIYANLLATAGPVGDLILVLGDSSAGRPDGMAQRVDGPVTASPFTPTAPGAAASLLAPGGGVAEITADPTEPTGTTVALSFAQDASSLQLESPAVPAHYGARLAADFIGDAQGRELRIQGAGLGTADTLQMAARADRRAFTLAGPSQQVAATLTQAGSQPGSASFAAVVPPSGAVGTLTSYDWTNVAQSLVWEKYFLGGATVAVVLQDNLAQRRSLVGDEVARIEGLIGALADSGVQHSLQVKLDQVRDQLARGDSAGGLAAAPQGYVTAANVARALRNEVRAQTAKAVPIAAAAQFEEAVDILRQMLGQPL